MLIKGKEGKCYLIINNSETETTTVDLPVDGTIYVLAGKDGNKRATIMTLNGNDLVLGENDALPDLSGASVSAGKIELAPMTCTFCLFILHFFVPLMVYIHTSL